MDQQVLSTRSPHLRILLAEDSVVYQKLAAGLLRSRGHELTIVGNGRDAVQAVSDCNFDVVLMDVEMPVMDGLEATTAIRLLETSSGSHVPIIAVTTMPADQCIEAGMDAFLPKPLNAVALDNLLSRLVNSAA